MRYALGLLYLIISVSTAAGQVTPEPCTNPPNGVGCLCSTAGILCTPEDLDGFTFSMSDEVNDGDLPTGGFFGADLCPGIGDQDGFPNNVNFFAFIVWCEDLTFDVAITNCQDNPDDNQESYGVQMAMFANCGSQYDNWDPVECITEGDDACFDTAGEVPAVQTFSASGLTIGGTYYFMLDGCARSVCDITINLVGTCGIGEIDDWTTGITGEEFTCVGSTHTYTAEDVNGAVEFYYYLDGVLIDDGEDLLSTEITWDTPGTYTLCVDVSNLPCIPETDDPPQDCMTIEVVDILEPVIAADPEILCPDLISTITVTGQSTETSLSSYIIITGPDSDVVYQIDEATTTTLTYDECGDFTAYYYTFFTADDPAIPLVGDTWTPPDCSDDCCEVVEVEIMFDDTEAPVFDDPPADYAVDCVEDIGPIEELVYTDDCIADGVAIGFETVDFTDCDGGTLVRKWTAMDSCSNSILYSQTITIGGIPEASFVDPPSDIDIDCGTLDTDYPDLLASNGESSSCLIDTMIMPTVVEDFDDCDGTVTLTWTFTDECDRTIEHVQVITLLPPEEPAFIDPPADESVDCDEIPATIADLDYTNSVTGDCEIMGSITPIVMADTTSCGGTITSTWQLTDECDRVIEHVQVITVNPPSAPQLDQMPADVDVVCGDPVPDAIDITATNGESGACGVTETISPTIVDNTDACEGTITYTWEYADDCGTTLTHTQTITVLPPAEPAWIDPPADETIECSMIPDAASDLMYTNSATDACEISGAVSPTVADNSSLCGGTIEYLWEFTDVCDRAISHTQVLTIEPAPSAEFTSLPADITIDCGDDAVTPSPLSYTNGADGSCLVEGEVDPVQDGDFDICGDDVTFTWEFTDECDNTITHTQTVTVNPAAEASFIDPPSEITVSCADFDENPPALSYDNNLDDECEIAGSVDGELVGAPDPCGTDIQFVWTFTDECDRTIEHIQNVAIEPAAPPVFTSLPDEDIALDCDEVPNVIPVLSYDNGETGTCNISGSVPGFQTGTYDECGGSINFTWTITDECGTTLSFTQFVEINPAPDPIWLNPPPDITISCGEDFPDPVQLEYSNGESAGSVCEIQGFEDAVVVQGDDYEYTWTFTNDCTGATITHTQIVSGVSTPELELDPTEAAICIGESFDLGTITATDLNGQNLTLEYFDGSGQQINNLIVQPTITTIYTILATNEDGCNDDAQFTLQVDPVSNAGGDGELDACASFGTYNLFDYLGAPFDDTGSLFDIDGSGANIDDPTNISFNGVDPGTYTFEYVVTSTNTCPDDIAILTVNVITDLDVEIVTAECNTTGTSYTITVLSYGNNIIASSGEVVVIDNDTVRIIDIPTSDLVVVTAIDPVSFCTTDLIVNPPDCDCPDVPAPMTGGDLTICAGDATPELSVTAAPGTTANWYDVQSGGVPLISMSDTYTPEETLPGIYSYYVEGVDSEGCISLVRTEVLLEIIALPEATDVAVSQCRDMAGQATFTLSEINPLVNPNLSFEVTYYLNVTDAEAGTNAIVGTYTTSDNNTQLVVRVISGTGCISFGTVDFILFDLPQVTIEVTDEVCLDDNNGTVVATSVTPAGTLLSLDNITFVNDLTFDSLASGDYTLYAQTSEGCEAEFPFTINPGIDLSILEFVSECNSNGTASNSDDDTYMISFVVSNQLGIVGNISVSVDGTDAGSYAYGDAISISQAADSDPRLIVVTDQSTGCITAIETDPLVPCSTDCEVVADPVTFICLDNGTPTDPSDDYYEVTFNATAINGSSNGTFNLSVDGTTVGTYGYGEGGTIELPASGQTVIINIIDNEDLQCFASQSIGPLVSCSGACLIDAEISITCNSNGTVGVEDDDFYDVSINVSGVNTATQYTLNIDNNVIGSYNYDESISTTIVADGAMHEIVITDVDDPTCVFTLTTGTFTPCSGSCEIDVVLEDAVCDNASTADDPSDDTFTAMVSIEISDGSGSWIITENQITGASGDQITVGPFLISNGDVTLTIADSNIPSCTTEITISAPSPCSQCDESVEAGPDAELDCIETVAPLEGSSSNTGDPLWTGPGGFSVLAYETTTEVPGTYYFSVDFGQSCVFTDSLIVSVSNEIPTANAGPNQDLTCQVDTVFLEGTVSGGSGNFEYSWTDEAGTVLATTTSLVVTEAGNYFFVANDLDTDCPSPPSAVTVGDLTSGPAAVISANPGDILDCVVEIIYLTSDSEPNVVYSWVINNQPVVADEITIEEPSEVMLMAIDTITGCENIDILLITSLEVYPLINLVSIGELNCIDAEITLDGSNSQSGESISFSWYDEDNNLIATGDENIQVTEEGTYYLELVDEDNGCTNRDTIMVSGDFDFPIVTDGSDLRLGCDDISVDLSVTIQDEAASNYDITWSTLDGNIVTPSTTSSVTIDVAGSYVISVLDPESMCETLDTIVVLPAEELTGVPIQVMDESCDENLDGVIIFEEPVSGTAPFTYLVNETVYVDPVVTGLSVGSYLASIIDAEGCSFDTTVTISVLESFEVNLAGEIQVIVGETTILAATVDIPDEDIASVQWLPSTDLSCDTCLVTEITGSQNTAETYLVEVIDINGCMVTAEIRIDLQEVVQTTFPNVISSNGDNNGNDRFTVYTSKENVIIQSMSIYDRWGELIYAGGGFATNDPSVGWDGTFDGQDVVPGVFVYVVELVLPDGTLEQYSGDLTVVR